MNAKNVLFPIVKAYQSQLPEEDVQHITMLAQKGEFGEALVDLCARLAENKVVLEPFDLLIMDDLAEDMKLDIVELRMIHNYLDL
jgi:hypothetical protein